MKLPENKKPIYTAVICVAVVATIIIIVKKKKCGCNKEAEEFLS